MKPVAVAGAAALAVVAVDAVVLFAGEGGRPGWAVAVQAAVAAAVAGSAVRLPVAALVAALVLGAAGGGNALLVWTGYQAGRRIVSRTRAAAAVGAVAVALGGQLLLLSAAPGPVVSRYVVFVALPALLGRALVQRRRLRSAYEEHRRQSRRERALLVDRERLHERLRIARDVHDSLGRRLSLLSVQAAALEVSDLPPPQQRQVLELAGTARRSLDELHELVGTLREYREPETRSLDELDTLAADFRTAGTPVTVRREGEQAVVAPAVEHVVYRVVEEGLTNAAKHAPGRPVAVSLRREEDTLLVGVRNPLPADRRTGSSGRTGHGLSGLDERVELAGGVLHVASDDTEFRLVAMLPLTEATGEEPEPREPPRDFRLWAVAFLIVAAALLVATGPAGAAGG